MIQIGVNTLHQPWYSNSKTVHLFIDLLVTASVTNPKGQCKVSRSHLAVSLGMSQQNVRTSLKHLQESGHITIDSTKGGTVITVVNFNQYINQETRHESPVSIVSVGKLVDEAVDYDKPVQAKFTAGPLNEKLLNEIERTPGKFVIGNNCLSRADRHDKAVAEAKGIPVEHLGYTGFVPALMGYTKSLKRPGRWLDESGMSLKQWSRLLQLPGCSRKPQP